MRAEKPQVAEEAKPFFTDAELAALLTVTRGQDFEAHRDHAINRYLRIRARSRHAESPMAVDRHQRARRGPRRNLRHPDHGQARRGDRGPELQALTQRAGKCLPWSH